MFKMLATYGAINPKLKRSIIVVKNIKKTINSKKYFGIPKRLIRLNKVLKFNIKSFRLLSA